MSPFDRMLDAMIEADSGPKGSTLFEIHNREFREGYAHTLKAALVAVRPVVHPDSNWIEGIDTVLSGAFQPKTHKEEEK